MKYLFSVPEFRKQYISNLILVLRDDFIKIDYLNVINLSNYIFNKKTVILSDKIKTSVYIIIFLDWVRFKKSDIWIILWNGDKDKKTYAFIFLSFFKFFLKIKIVAPFFPNSPQSSFIPIPTPPSASICKDKNFSKKIVFIGEIYNKINDILINKKINDISWNFAQKIFDGTENIENLILYFDSFSHEYWVTINRIRFMFLDQLSKDFDNLILIGDDFLNLNFKNSLPTNHSILYRHKIFASSLLNIDFLSKSILSPVYPRSIECIGLNKNHLQLKTKSFENLFGKNTFIHTFDSYNDLKNRIIEIIKNPDFFVHSTLQEELQQLLNQQKINLFNIKKNRNEAIIH
jgi:hypothetical protein